VRELGNVIEYAVTLCDGDVIDEHHLPPSLGPGAAAPTGGLLDDLVFKTAKERFERRYLTELMRISNGNLSDAARRSGIDRSNLRRLLRRNGFDGTGGSTRDDATDDSGD
jgi:DNA-binding NtrC family response regulator